MIDKDECHFNSDALMFCVNTQYFQKPEHISSLFPGLKAPVPTPPAPGKRPVPTEPTRAPPGSPPTAPGPPPTPPGPPPSPPATPPAPPGPPLTPPAAVPSGL